MISFSITVLVLEAISIVMFCSSNLCNGMTRGLLPTIAVILMGICVLFSPVSLVMSIQELKKEENVEESKKSIVISIVDIALILLFGVFMFILYFGHRVRPLLIIEMFGIKSWL